MASLGDYFPPGNREEFSGRILLPGCVIRSFVPDTLPPKYKFWIIISISGEMDELGAVYVNTAPNDFILRNPVLSRLQILMKSDERNLFDVDCYADCSRVRAKQITAIKSQIQNDPGIVRGTLTKAELSQLLHSLHSATTISVADKRRFGLM